MAGEEPRRLSPELGRLDVFSIATGAMISSGLFVLPGLVYAKAGPAAIVAYVLAGLLVPPAVLAKAELVTGMPKAGSDHFFIGRSMGAAGTIGGLACWFSLSFKSAFALVGIGAFATLVSPAVDLWHIKLVAVGFCVFFVILNNDQRETHGTRPERARAYAHRPAGLLHRWRVTRAQRASVHPVPAGAP